MRYLSKTPANPGVFGVLKSRARVARSGQHGAVLRWRASADGIGAESELRVKVIADYPPRLEVPLDDPSCVAVHVDALILRPARPLASQASRASRRKKSTKPAKS